MSPTGAPPWNSCAHSGSRKLNTGLIVVTEGIEMSQHLPLILIRSAKGLIYQQSPLELVA